MPSREQTISDGIRIFENAEYPSGLNPETTWLGIYQTLLWYEPVNWLGIDQLPHIIDANRLRPSSPSKKQSWTNPSIWQRRGQAVNIYLASQLGCNIEELQVKTDQLMKHPEYSGMQRQNTLGTAFVGLVKHILEMFGSIQIRYETEVEASTIFHGITFPGRSSTPRIDLLARGDNIPCAIISAKWSLRHDRLNDITNECPVYKSAYDRIYRSSRRAKLPYYLITNEYDPTRLSKVLGDNCLDGVVHVHKAAIVNICGMNGRLDQLIDLADFINYSMSW